MTDAEDLAWKIHAAQVDWTGKVDTKASSAFTFESAALAVIVALSQQGRTFSNISTDLERWMYWIGVGLLLFGAGLALAVVIPRLRSRVAKREAKENYIYFGHLRHWKPQDLAAKLDSTALLDVLARQCIAMAKICWRKYRLAQWSIIVGMLGIGVIVVCGVIISWPVV